MTVVYMSTNDIYQLFIKFNVPGVRKEVARLAQGVNMGDAGVMGELLQAAHDPSAGQRAVQAGEAVPQQCLAFDQQALVSVLQANNAAMTSSMTSAMQANNAAMTSSMTSVMTSAMTSAMTGVLQANNAAMQANNAAMTSAMHTLVTRIDDRLDAKFAENKADADAKFAENKADADAKFAENKADADAKFAENKADADAKFAQMDAKIMKALAAIPSAVPVWPQNASELCQGVNDSWNSFQRAQKGRSVSTAEWMAARAKLWAEYDVLQLVDDSSSLIPSGAAAGIPAVAKPVGEHIRKKGPYIHYTDESIKKTKEWVLRNTVCGEIRQLIPKHKKGDDLRKELGIDTKKRMLSLIYKIRSKYFEKNVEGAWCKRVA